MPTQPLAEVFGFPIDNMSPEAERYSQQSSLFEDRLLEPIVNVAGVPQRSPFRYPGGKTWLVPRVRRWLNSKPTRPTELIEPFAGGGIISLTVAFEHLTDKATMVELDDDIASVWQTIASPDAGKLAQAILDFDMNKTNVSAILSGTGGQLWEKAFRTILRNRVNRGGILAPGAGLIKEGENGKGLRSRWYPETLKQRIIDITSVQDRINFIHGDGMAALRENALRSDVVFFVDPPYSAAGKKAGSRLYKHWQLRHEELFRLVSSCAGDFLMTYNDAPELHELAAFYGLDTLLAGMKNTHHARMTELLIGRDLDWARR